MAGTASGDDRGDTSASQCAAVDVVVVTTVGVEPIWSLPWPPSDAADRRDRVDQGQEFDDIVPVATGQARGERDAARVGDDVVFRARLAAVDRTRTGFGPPLSALTWEPSITALDMSN